jgi:hypothetical protein
VLAGFRDYTQLTGGKGNVFCAYGAASAPVAYAGATALSGPLLWNGSAVGGGRGVTAYLIAVGWAVTTASTANGLLGVAAGSGQAAAPTSTTGITTVGNMRVGGAAAGPAPACTVYLTGTVAVAPTVFVPLGPVFTGATSSGVQATSLESLGGLIEVGTGGYAAILANVALTLAVVSIGIVWIECAND